MTQGANGACMLNKMDMISYLHDFNYYQDNYNARTPSCAYDQQFYHQQFDPVAVARVAALGNCRGKAGKININSFPHIKKKLYKHFIIFLIKLRKLFPFMIRAIRRDHRG